LKSTFTLQRYKKTGLKDLTALNGVESDLADPNPSIYAGKGAVVRIKHSTPATE
jgi:hypothetical protein